MIFSKSLNPFLDRLARFKTLMIVGVVALLVVAWGIAERLHHYQMLKIEADETAHARVVLMAPQPSPRRHRFTLPANLAAWYQAPIYAQVSGYVKMWYKDFGAHVKAGDVLAEISAPSLDAQFAAAKANLKVVTARYNLAKITAKRWSKLRDTQAVSRQEVDVQVANAQAQEAKVEQARYEVERYAALENFKRIIAPFDGIVTSRLVNVGDYVNAGSGDLNARGGASELFTVADTHRMRVFVSMPQGYTISQSKDWYVDLTLPQTPKRVYKAKFLATAKAFNLATRTVTTEFELDNPDGSLWPDAYATAHFDVPDDSGALTVPVNALIFRAQGTQLATVVNHRVHLVAVQTGINYGTTIQILNGLSMNDRIVANPTADMMEGDEVKIVQPTKGYNDTSTMEPTQAAPLIPQDSLPARQKEQTPADHRRQIIPDNEPQSVDNGKKE